MTTAGTAAGAAAVGVPGLDVSSFQGIPAVWRGRAGAFGWCAVKITEHYPTGRTYFNPDAPADWSFLREDGHKVRVAYLFAHPGSSPQASASAFLTAVNRLGVEDSDAVAIDLEVTDGQSPAHVDAWALAAEGIITRALGRPVVLYTFLNFAGEGNTAHLGHMPLWIADPSRPAGHPRVPGPWQTWALHQYATTANIDRDIARYTTREEMRAALGRPAPTSPVTEFPGDGHASWRDIAHHHGIEPAHLLRLNGGPHMPFTPAVAAYINRARLDLPVPAGVTVRVPRKP